MTTPVQYAQDFLDGVRARLRPELAARVDFSEGSRWDALAGGIARVMLRLEQVSTTAYDAHVLDLATGADLDVYCQRKGPIRRHAASKARGPLTLSRPSAAAGAGTIPAGTEIRVPYKNSSALFVVAADTACAALALTVQVPVEAQLAGLGTNVGEVLAGLALTGQPAPLWDATLLPTAIFANGGADAESDAELRDRQRAYEQGKRGGTTAAITTAALSVPGVKRVVLGSRYSTHTGSEGVCYIGDASWGSNSILLGEVAKALESWRAFGPSIQIRPIGTVSVTVVLTVTMAQGLTTYSESKLRDAIMAKVLAYFSDRSDPYAWSQTALAARAMHAHDDIAAVSAVTTNGVIPISGSGSPFTAASIASTGGFPASLTVAVTDPSLVTINLQGPG